MTASATPGRRVLITGASSGIGMAFARQLGAGGHDLVLTARREENLRSLADEIRDRHGVAVDYLTVDLAERDAPARIDAAIAARDWKLGGLINNAGFGALGRFERIPVERQCGMIDVNVTRLVELSHRMIPHLQGAPGAFIINVASAAAFQAIPKFAVYAATKAFVLSFSEALHEELRGKGITVSALCPGATDTEFAEAANMTHSGLFDRGVMTADDVARIGLAKRKNAIVVAGSRNLASSVAAKLAPRSVARKIAGWIVS
ncbi:MAG: short-chain dehydrogenase [Hyphomicrobiales bacterium]|nr:MAG: short-chain dehydrogenase [Hyphomicrobiales bacterium]